MISDREQKSPTINPERSSPTTENPTLYNAKELETASLYSSLTVHVEDAQSVCFLYDSASSTYSATMDLFERFRPRSHFIAPHSWSNDPCGAVYVPETKEYLVCYQWNPGTTIGGNCAWGMAKSKDLITWEDCPPPLWNGTTYDSKGVFSGSIQSAVIDGKRVLLLYYTSVSNLPIHWSKPYLDGCETQSIAVSTDLGRSWDRYNQNPVLVNPPRGPATTGWRDPFVSEWTSLARLMELDDSSSFMLLSSGERHQAPELHLYVSRNLLSWEPLSTPLEFKCDPKLSRNGPFVKGVNFECASFFSFEDTEYIIVGIEEEDDTLHHNGHSLMWMSGRLLLRCGKPVFEVLAHGILDHGILYAAHIFRDAQGRLLQLGWADESASTFVVTSQGWSGCIGLPRELYHITEPATDAGRKSDEWAVDERSGLMSTLGIRPAQQVVGLRGQSEPTQLQDLPALRSVKFEISAIFSELNGHEKLVFHVRASPDLAEVTKVVIDVANETVLVDRRRSSLANLGARTTDQGKIQLLPGENLDVRLFVDNSIVEVFVNNRFSLTSRIYPSLELSTGVSCGFGNCDTSQIIFNCWTGLEHAWPDRAAGCHLLEELNPLRVVAEKSSERVNVEVLPRLSQVIA